VSGCFESCLGFGCEGLWYDGLLDYMYDLDIRSLVIFTTIQFALHLLHTLTSRICAWHYCFIDHFTLELEPTFCSCVHHTFHKERIVVDAKV